MGAERIPAKTKVPEVFRSLFLVLKVHCGNTVDLLLQQMDVSGVERPGVELRTVRHGGRGGFLVGVAASPQKCEGSMFIRRRIGRVGVAALALAGGLALVTPTMASAATAASSTHNAVTGQARPAAASITWSNRKQISLRDRCGGTNGWIQWSGANLQIYGEVWTSAQSCGGPGVHYVKVTFAAGPEVSYWSSANPGGQGEGGTAGPNQTVGYNSYVINSSPWNFSNLTVYLCSSEGTGNCNVSQHY
jgi:hypothetical protein